MDQLDIAQILDARFRQQALAVRKELIRAEGETISRTRCIECDDEIPEGRRQAAPGCIRCIDCQQEWEHEHL